LGIALRNSERLSPSQSEAALCLFAALTTGDVGAEMTKLQGEEELPRI
jgi:cytochrome c-type biogenesis protein CcmH/NrfG